MKIIDKVLERKALILADPVEAAANAEKAVAAIIGGVKSVAWRTYMQQYTEIGNTDQLMRLTATDGSAGDVNLDRRRAYLVGNAVCGETTGNLLDREVLSIDEDVPVGGNCQPTP